VALSDLKIRAAKPKAKPYKLTDGEGLYLLISATGAKLWRLGYRLAGKQKGLALGSYPTISLAEARQQRDEARKLLATGNDPALKRKLDKQHQAVTFRLIAEELVEKMRREGRAEATLTKTKWLLTFAYPFIGSRPIREISAPEVLALLRSIEKRGRYETARRARSTCGMVFRFAIATARADRDPTADLRGALTAPKAKHRAAITDPTSIGALLRAIEGYQSQAITRLALKLAPLTMVRPGELRRAEWDEIDFDNREWRIPAEKMKMGRPHRVPLSRQAVAVLRELYTLTGRSQWVFPSVSGTRSFLLPDRAGARRIWCADPQDSEGSRRFNARVRNGLFQLFGGQ